MKENACMIDIKLKVNIGNVKKKNESILCKN